MELFFEKKSELEITVNELIKELNVKHGINVQKICYDIAGENEMLVALFKQEGHSITNIMHQTSHNKMVELSKNCHFNWKVSCDIEQW